QDDNTCGTSASTHAMHGRKRRTAAGGAGCGDSVTERRTAVAPAARARVLGRILVLALVPAVVLVVGLAVDQVGHVLVGGRHDAPRALGHGDAGLRGSRGQLRSVARVGNRPGLLIVPARTAAARTTTVAGIARLAA